MKTRIVRVRQNAETFTPREDADLRSAGELIRSGGLVAFPTETVYGLGGDALNRESSRKIYAAKGRPSDNPLIVHICRLEDIREIASEVPDVALKIADAFWPGPLTMILKKEKKLMVIIPLVLILLLGFVEHNLLKNLHYKIKIQMLQNQLLKRLQMQL